LIVIKIFHRILDNEFTEELWENIGWEPDVLLLWNYLEFIFKL